MIIRSRSSVGFTLLALLAVGCGVFGGSDDTQVAPAAPAGEAPLPPGAPPPATGTPSTDEVTEAFGVFVAPGGSDQNGGTRRSPFATIGAAIKSAKPQAKRVYVCAGTYGESVELASAVSLVGGYDCNDPSAWRRAAGARSTIAGTTVPALRAKDITSTTRFEGFTVTAPDAKDPGTSSIGLWAENAGKLAIVDASITAGRGADGAPGSNPAAPAGDGSGQGAGAGTYAYDKPAKDPNVVGTPWPKPALAAGGTSTCGGNAGGTGGRGGLYVCQRFNNKLQMVYGGDTNLLGNVVPASTELPAVTFTAAAGFPGTDGASALVPGTLSATGFTPSDGTAGSPGAAGPGGSGGAAEPLTRFQQQIPDGMGGFVTATACLEGKYYTLANGPGGGSGGCGASPGAVGKGGGASIAAFVVASAGLSFETSVLQGGAGGRGGEGSFGSEPTAGGAAGSTQGIAYVGAAAAGSPGGRAGISGSGAGGSSFGLVYAGTAPVQKETTAKAGPRGEGVPEKTWRSTVSGQEATLPASVAGHAKDVASF